MMENYFALSLAVNIVSAQRNNSERSAKESVELISSVFNELIALATKTSVSQSKPVPIVAVASSVTREKIVCLECGTATKVLKRHLNINHGETPEQYRLKYSLPTDYPMIAADYSVKRSKLAKSLGLGRNKVVAVVGYAQRSDADTGMISV